MRAVQTNLRNFIAESQYFSIPDFQRPYAWKSLQGEAFWESMSDTASNSKRHYFGSIVFFQDGESRVVIDGQQRLTTTLLFITACYHMLCDDSRRSWTYTADQLGRTFLYNEENGNLRVILRGATSDRETFDRILRRKTLPIDEHSKLYEMYTFFMQKLKDEDKLDKYIDILERIDMISILLTPEDDNPQVVFENINATGEPLTDGDKIRNFALMLNSQEARTMVYHDYWLKIEKSLTRSNEYTGVGQQLISAFFRVFLTIKYNDKVINAENTYERFKEYYREATPDQSIEQLQKSWSDITSILEDYVYLLWGQDITEGNKFDVFDEIMDMSSKKIAVSHLSFFIQLLEYFKQGELTRNDFRNILAVVEKQQMRDEIGGTGGLKLINSTAHVAYKHFKNYDMNSFYDAYLWLMEGAGDLSKSRNTSDTEIEFAITNKDISDKFAMTLLSELDAKHDGNSSSYGKKVAHIMPKAIYGFRLDDDWKQELGEGWEIINQRFYGKLANIAIVSYPPTMNKTMTFAQNLERHDGIGGANNYTTKWIRENCNRWNIYALEARTKWLRDEILKLYELPHPLISQSIRDKYGDHS